MMTTPNAHDYDRRRLANIRRNLEQLAEIGLAGPAARNAHGKRKLPSTSSAPRSKQTRSQQPQQRAVPTRQSARLQTLNATAVQTKDSGILDNDDTERSDVAPSMKSQVARRPPQRKPTPMPMASADDTIIASHAVGAGVSIKSVRARVTEATGEWVGKVILPPPGSGSLKAAAMTVLAEHTPRFSKYSGIQEFANAIVLFVNVAGSDYDNMFQEEEEGGAEEGQNHVQQQQQQQGTTIPDVPFSTDQHEKRNIKSGKRATVTWFAQTRQHEETPVIQRMLAGSTPVILLCRLPASPYVCCGGLTLKECDLGATPMRFVWQIDSWDSLVSRSAPFQSIMSAAQDDE